jgi:MFS family permease
MLTVMIQDTVAREHAGKAFAFVYTMWTGSMVLGLLLATPLFAFYPVRAVFMSASLLAVALSVLGLVIVSRRWASG